MAERKIISALALSLEKLGIKGGDSLLVHSSLRSLGGVAPDEIIGALIEVLGSEGTLMFPTLSYETVNARNPFFDCRYTPSNVGALSVLLRNISARTTRRCAACRLRIPARQ